MRSVSIVSFVLLSLTFTACSSEDPNAATKKLKIGFITNGISDFWTIGGAGAQKAADEIGAQLKIVKPTPKGRVNDQKSAMEDMISAGYAGIAISPIDPANQTAFLNKAAARTVLITQDSDAPQSDRQCFIGVNNYKAGRMCGQLVKEAIPAGGKVMLFIGGLSGDNAKLRRQGVIDEVLGRSEDASRRDPTGSPIQSADGKYVILGCMTDSHDYTVGKNNAEDALTRHEDLACMVGLYAYNPPLILQALKQAGKLKKVKVVGFDEDKNTLQGVRDGTVHGTVVQDPYEYGYRSVKVVAAVAKGDKSVIPANGIIDVPARKITAATVDAFAEELAERLAGGAATRDK